MNSETPFPGNVPGGDDDVPYEWLDEWLCEYVDGTMDPSLEAVFEQYVEANPDLEAHIQRLKETRRLLCECGLPRDDSQEIEDEICSELECDSPSRPPLSDVLQDRPAAAFGLASSIAIALVVGFLIGATFTPAPAPVSTSVPSPPQMESRKPESPSFETTRPSSPASDAPLLQFSGSPSPDSTHAASPLTMIELP